MHTARRLILIAAVLMFIVISSASASSNETDASGSSVSVDTSFAEKALIIFRPSDDADGYFLTATETGGRRHTVSSWIRHGEGDGSGSKRVLMQGLRPDTEYSLEITSLRENGERTVRSTGITFRTCPLPEEPPMHQPISWLSGITNIDRYDGTFTAVITTLKTPGLMYEASVVKDTRSRRDRAYPMILPLGEETHINGLTKYSEITVRHGKTTEAGILWSEETTTLTFPNNVELYDGDFVVSVSEDGEFSWSGLTDGRKVTLYRHTREKGSVPLETVEAAESGRFTVKDEHWMQSAIYYASTGQKISVPVFYTTPPDIEVETTEKSITLRWKEPEGSSIAYSGIMTPARDRYGNVTLHIAQLDSNTSYPFDIKAIYSDGRTAEKHFSVRTGSFEGIYEWKASKSSSKTVPSFAVTVREAPEGSDFGYYIYTDPRDAKSIEEGSFREQRLMPLYDTSLGEKAPSDFIPFSSDDPKTLSYRWNESKWNKGSLHPNGWMPVSMDISKDRYESVVRSKAAFGVKVDTRTVFEFFIAPDGKPMLRFMNMAVGNNAGLANGALFKNITPDGSLGENEYTYALERIGDLPF